MGRQSEFLIGLICLNAFAANNVIKLKTNQFEVLSEAGEASARRVLERVETARQVFEGVRFSITIVIFGSERTYAPFRLGPSVSGFHQSGPDRDWIGILNSGPETERIATHEFLHALMSRAPVRYPKWLEEGTAELYSNVEVRGDRIVVGLPIREHVKRLQAVSDSVLFGDRTDQDEVKNEAEFYAESWALAHMLHLSPGYRERMPAFIEALSGGTPAVVAFRTFGKTPEQVIEDLRAYVRSGMPAVALGAPERESYRAPDLEKVAEPDALVMRAELLLLMGRNEAAERIYLDVAKKFPSSPAAWTGLAILALRDRHYDTGRDLFRKAIELGSRDADTYFEYAMLLDQTGADPAEVDRTLSKALDISPNHAEALRILGLRTGEVKYLKRATELLPRQSMLWQELASAYLKQGQSADARAAARKALQLAVTPQEEGMARSVMESIP